MWCWNFKSLSRQKKLVVKQCRSFVGLLTYLRIFLCIPLGCKETSFLLLLEMFLYAYLKDVVKYWLQNYFIFSSYHIVAHINSQQFYKCWVDKLVRHNLWLPLILNTPSLCFSDHLLHFLKLQSSQCQWVSFTLYLRPKLSLVAWETFSTPSWDWEGEIFHNILSVWAGMKNSSSKLGEERRFMLF